jgi:hypothetical protein
MHGKISLDGVVEMRDSQGLPQKRLLAYNLSVMDKSASICVTGDSEMQFEWFDFDGDDCFDDFHVNVTIGTVRARFDFGPCAVHGLRKLSKFFRDAAQTAASLGFRHPDIRHCDVYRTEDGYRLAVRFEGSGLQEEVCIHSPSVQIDDEFLKLY